MPQSNPDDDELALLKMGLRRNLSEFKTQCEWRWQCLADLGTLPPMKHDEIPSSELNDLPELAQACYHIGQFKAYSQAGTFIEHLLHHIVELDKDRLQEQVADNPEKYFLNTPYENPHPP